MAYKRPRSYSAPGMSKKRRYVRRRPVYRKKRPFKRRYSRKGIRSARATPRIAKTIMMKQPAMPDRLFTTFSWRTTGLFTTGTSGAASWRNFSLNSLGIVEYTSGTPDQHYPRYVNQWLNDNFYTKYRVYATTVEIVFRGTSGDLETLMLVHQTDDSSDLGAITPTVAYQNGELPDFTTRVVNGTDGGGEGNIARFKARYKMATCFGVKKGAIYSEEDYEGQAVAGVVGVPDSQQFLHVGLASHPNSAPAAGTTCGYEVYFKFHAVLSENSNSAPVGAQPT